MYKDKDKANQAAKERMRRYRSKGVTTEGVTNQLKANTVTPNMRRGKDIQCFADLPPDVQVTVIRLTTNQDGSVDEQARTNRTAIAINYQHVFPDKYECHSIGIAPADMLPNPVPVKVSLPGDADYKPLCATTREGQASR